MTLNKSTLNQVWFSNSFWWLWTLHICFQ